MQNNNILHLEDFREPKARPVSISANQAFYGARVDYNLKNISTTWYEYFTRLLESLFKTLIHSNVKFTDAWFYIKVEHEFKKLSLHQCKSLLIIIDDYLLRPHLQDSKEREFYMRIRNLCFMKVYYFRKKI